MSLITSSVTSIFMSGLVSRWRDMETQGCHITSAVFPSGQSRTRGAGLVPPPVLRRPSGYRRRGGVRFSRRLRGGARSCLSGASFGVARLDGGAELRCDPRPADTGAEADRDLCGPFGCSSDERRGNGVLGGAQREVTIRLQGEGLLPQELEGHVGQSGSAQPGTTFAGGAVAQRRSRAAPRTVLPGRNSPARNGRGRVLGITVVRWAGAPGEADEPEQKVSGASSRRPGQICGGEWGDVFFADTPASCSTGLSRFSHVTNQDKGGRQ